jgi:signal transduction histidine kinase
MFYTDKDKLDLIVKNLVSNSVKYSPEQSEIFVGLKILNSELTVEVADHGKGISPENRQIIFDRFRQLDERINSVNTGHGLGLSIVEAFTSILGGSIMIEGNAGGGIVVKVGIPKSAENSEWDDLEDFIIDSETSF